MCPDATLKLFVTADPAARAARRLAELRERGDSRATLTLEVVLADIKARPPGAFALHSYHLMCDAFCKASLVTVDRCGVCCFARRRGTSGTPHGQLHLYGQHQVLFCWTRTPTAQKRRLQRLYGMLMLHLPTGKLQTVPSAWRALCVTI